MRKLVAVLLALVMMIGIFSACGTKNPVAEAKGYESPALKAQVEAGTLAKVEERLPVESDRFVYDFSGGNYGGTYNSMDYSNWGICNLTEEFMFMFNEDGSVYPNVAKSVDVSADGLVYTVKLREGMKWSDGVDFTADDVYFYYYHCLLAWKDGKPVSNVAGYTSKTYNWYDTLDENGNDVPLKLEVVDDYTFTMTLNQPKPTLLQNIAIDNKWLFAPKHWMVKYVARKDGVADDPTFPLITEEQALANANADGYDFDSYKNLGKAFGYYYWLEVGRPTIRAWNVTNKINIDTTVVLERNPYYWKVDADGRQLPYIDTLAITKVDASIQVQEMVAGNYDMMKMAAAKNYTTLRDGMTSGNYYMTAGKGTDWTNLGLQFNETYKDLQYRALFASVDFRQAMSLSIDKNELCKIVFEDLAEPRACVPFEGSIGYTEGSYSKWMEYDVAKANGILDKIAGVSAIGADGYRTFTEGDNAGKKISIEILYYTQSPEYELAFPLIEKYFKAVGIEAIARVRAKTDGEKEVYTGDAVMCWMTSTACLNIYLRPDAVAPTRTITVFYGLYGNEFPEGTRLTAADAKAAGNEGMYKLITACENMTKAQTIEDVQKYAQEIGALHAEYGYIIGLCKSLDGYNCISNNLKNFPDSYVNADEFQYVAICKPYTWYFEDPSIE